MTRHDPAADAVRPAERPQGQPATTRDNQTDPDTGATPRHGPQLLRGVCDHARPTGLELVLDANNLLPFHFLRTGDRLGRAVVKLERADHGAGTGFLVAPNLLLTNHHVLPGRATARITRACANYEAESPDGEAAQPLTVSLDPDAFFATQSELDFTFCAVQGLDHLGAIPLLRDSLVVVPSDLVNIIQHPRGRPKEVALQDNRVARVDNVIVQYSCDTEPGSSGSPVFNNQWNLVALHHASVAVDDALGRPALGLAPTSRYLNEGIRISAIAVWLETAEAERNLGREAVLRLRALFQGLDSQIGYFGALGRDFPTLSGSDAVAECYRNRNGLLDIGYWNLGAAERLSRQNLATIGWFLAASGLDVWCLAGASRALAQAVCDHAQAMYRLEYRLFANDHSEPSAVLVRAGTGWVERWHGGPGRRSRLLLKKSYGRRPPEEVQIAMLDRMPDHEARRQQFESALREASERPGSDLVLLGEGFSCRDLQPLASTNRSLRAAFGPHGGAAVLAAASSSLATVYASRDLIETIGGPRDLVAAGDRAWPPELDLLRRAQPVAIRLTYASSPTTRPRAPKPRRDGPHDPSGPARPACGEPDGEAETQGRMLRPEADGAAQPRD
jgi:hypothetical protein